MPRSSSKEKDLGRARPMPKRAQSSRNVLLSSDASTVSSAPSSKSSAAKSATKKERPSMKTRRASSTSALIVHKPTRFDIMPDSVGISDYVMPLNDTCSSEPFALGADFDLVSTPKQDNKTSLFLRRGGELTTIIDSPGVDLDWEDKYHELNLELTTLQRKYKKLEKVNGHLGRESFGGIDTDTLIGKLLKENKKLKEKLSAAKADSNEKQQELKATKQRLEAEKRSSDVKLGKLSVENAKLKLDLSDEREKRFLAASTDAGGVFANALPDLRKSSTYEVDDGTGRSRRSSLSRKTSSSPTSSRKTSSSHSPSHSPATSLANADQLIPQITISKPKRKSSVEKPRRKPSIEKPRRKSSMEHPRRSKPSIEQISDAFKSLLVDEEALPTRRRRSVGMSAC